MDRRAQAQVAWRDIYYRGQRGELTGPAFQQAMREWQAEFPEYAPDENGCCGNIRDAG